MAGAGRLLVSRKVGDSPRGIESLRSTAPVPQRYLAVQGDGDEELSRMYRHQM